MQNWSSNQIMMICDLFVFWVQRQLYEAFLNKELVHLAASEGNTLAAITVSISFKFFFFSQSCVLLFFCLVALSVLL
jgi:hypothetical protein